MRLCSPVARLVATAVAAIALALAAAPSRAGADPTQTLTAHLERVLAEASPGLVACGAAVGLPSPAPTVDIRLVFAGGKIKVELTGLDTVVKAKRRPLEKCLRAAVAAQTVAKASLEFRPLALESVPVPVPVPVYDPVAAAACTTSADCTIICETAEGCCGGQCGCRNAVNKSQVEAIRARKANNCKAPPKCPAVACALQHFHAECVQNKCRAVQGMGF